MSKIHTISFDLSALTIAYKAAADYHTAFDTFCAEMMQWHAAGVYPTNGEVKDAIKAADSELKPASVSVYACNLLKWAKAGKTPANMRACVNKAPEGHVKATNKGRPAGQGAGKTTAPAEKNSGAAADPLAPTEAVSPMHRWVVQANTLSAAAFMLRNQRNEAMNTDDAKALQDAANTIAALLGKYTK